MKTCSGCKKSKLESNFYRTKNGGFRKCKDCIKEQCSIWGKKNRKIITSNTRRWREQNPEKARLQSYNNYWKNKDKFLSIERKRMKAYPEKRRATNAINNGIRDGKIKREKCIYCSKTGEGHHPDYSKPLEVLWLCRSHHIRLHKNTL